MQGVERETARTLLRQANKDLEMHILSQLEENKNASRERRSFKGFLKAL